MSDGPQLPFGFGSFDVNEIVRMLRSEGPINLEVARQIAVWVALQDDAADAAGETPSAASGEPGAAGVGFPGTIPLGTPPEEEPVDPEERRVLGELARTAAIHVREATGLGHHLPQEPGTLTRAEWARSTIDGLEPVLTTLAERLAASMEASATGGLSFDEPGDEPGREPGDLSGLLTAVAPILLGVQAGFMIGHLAGRALGRYEMPLPHAGSPTVELIVPNIVAFADDWQLPGEELRFYVALHETLHAAVLSVPWVHERLLALADRYAAAFEIDPRQVEDRLGDVDPTNPGALQAALGDPAEFLDAVRPPAQREVLAHLRTLVALVEGYADFVLADVGEHLIPSFAQIREASHRHRVERGEAQRFLEALLGFEVGRADYERAAAFCAGVAERKGPEGLGRLWEDPRMIPTEAELEAPGLWLERLEIMDDDLMGDDV